MRIINFSTDNLTLAFARFACAISIKKSRIDKIMQNTQRLL